MLASTTLFVSQYHQTFIPRFADFPVRTIRLGRFQGGAGSRKTLEGLTSGRANLVIGTHQLLTKEVVFEDLGLVIIDEEQQFDVEREEHLKELRINVDTLSVSAIPIPRTLKTVITSIREMSVVTTLLKERHPVLTLVGPYDKGQVQITIRCELVREGQVFFAHNRIESIDKVVAELHDLVPETHMVTTHGQMRGSKLE